MCFRSDNYSNMISVDQGSLINISHDFTYSGFRTTQGTFIDDPTKFTITPIGYNPSASTSVIDSAFANTSTNTDGFLWSAVKNFDTTKDQIAPIYQTDTNTVSSISSESNTFTVSLKLEGANSISNRWVIPSEKFDPDFDASYVCVSDFEFVQIDV